MAKKPAPFNNPFGGLKLEKPKQEKGRASGPASSSRSAPLASVSRKATRSGDEEEAELFRQSVGEVSPVRAKAGRAPPPEPPSAASLRIVSAEMEALAQLCQLVAGDGPMDVLSSDERVEGRAPGLDERVMIRLRAGDYAVQAHLDLHGLTRDEAKVELEGFLRKALTVGLRCVLVVTGRGLHSKDQISVLKEGVQAWLTRGRLASKVLAFTSARPKDGGAGAVYVLLRK